MDLMRYTIVDGAKRISFVGPVTALQSLVAACATNPRSVDQMLAAIEGYQPKLAEHVRSGLAVFDEHNSAGNFSHIHAAIDFCKPQDLPPFRVLDARTREASLTPVRAGVVLFNLNAKRIVQIQNTWREIERKGRVRIMDRETSTTRVHRYELPAEWSLVPER